MKEPYKINLLIIQKHKGKYHYEPLTLKEDEDVLYHLKRFKYVAKVLIYESSVLMHYTAAEMNTKMSNNNKNLY